MKIVRNIRKHNYIEKCKKIIRYYPIHSFNEKRKIMHEGNINDNSTIALCTMAKMENNYISEWVDYNLNIGFDHIFIYDNNDIDSEKIIDALNNTQLDKVTIIDIIGFKIVQSKIFTECYKTYSKYFKWIAFFDVDEFITLKDNNNIKDYVNDPIFTNYKSIRINWLTMTDNNLIYYENKPVIERFTEANFDCNFRNSQVKSIIRTNISGFYMNGPHITTATNSICDNCGNSVTTIDSFKICNYNYNKAYIRHFITKSLEEFVKNKKTRGYNWRKNDKLTKEFYFSQNIKTEEKNKLFDKFLNEKNY